MKIVLKLGGSFLVPDKPDTVYYKAISGLVKKLSDEFSIAIVVGGGKICRIYQAAAREFGADNEYLDTIGTDVARVNARVFISSLGNLAYQDPFVKLENIPENPEKIAVLGGLKPGQSTDAVAAQVASRINADLLVISTDVDYIYTDDPKTSPDAKKLEKLTTDELKKIISQTKESPGHYAVIDSVAVDAIEKNRIRTILLNGKNIENMEKAIRGEKFTGTEVVI